MQCKHGNGLGQPCSHGAAGKIKGPGWNGIHAGVSLISDLNQTMGGMLRGSTKCCCLLQVLANVHGL